MIISTKNSDGMKSVSEKFRPATKKKLSLPIDIFDEITNDLAFYIFCFSEEWMVGPTWVSIPSISSKVYLCCCFLLKWIRCKKRIFISQMNDTNEIFLNGSKAESNFFHFRLLRVHLGSWKLRLHFWSKGLKSLGAIFKKTFNCG